MPVKGIQALGCAPERCSQSPQVFRTDFGRLVRMAHGMQTAMRAEGLERDHCGEVRMGREQGTRWQIDLCCGWGIVDAKATAKERNQEFGR